MCVCVCVCVCLNPSVCECEITSALVCATYVWCVGVCYTLYVYIILFMMHIVGELVQRNYHVNVCKT